MAELQTQTEAGAITQIFIEFVMMQAQNAALFLGQIPNPNGQPPEINLPLARMFIDQLAVIEVKTQGNLNPEELRVLTDAVTQLDTAFNEIASRTEGFHPGESLAPPEPSPIATITPPSPPEEIPPPPPQEENPKRFTKSYGA